MKMLITTQLAILAIVCVAAYGEGSNATVRGVKENRPATAWEAVHMGLVEMVVAGAPVVMNVSIHLGPDKDHVTVGASNAYINNVGFDRGIVIEDFVAKE